MPKWVLGFDEWKKDVTIHSAYFEGNDTSGTAEENIMVEND